MTTTETTAPSAPAGWRNWRAHLGRAAERGTVEYVLYSDSHWSAEIAEDLGPYQVLNLVAGGVEPHAGEAHPVLALRASWHLGDPEPTFPVVPEKVRPGSYHGGWIDEEIAALLSLALHVRCRSGGAWRDFGFISQDPRGRPFSFELRPPQLIAPQPGGTPLLPGIAQHVDLRGAQDLLRRYFELPPAEARGLVRAARLFQQALWVADADPRISWLQLFAALEAAADAWSGARGSPRERIAQSWDALNQLLNEAEPDLAERLAELLAPLVRAQFRVLRFVAAFPPPPPPEPRAVFAPVDWERLEDHLRALYDLRSKALHAGIPIPEPLSHPPRRDEQEGSWMEAPAGLGVHVGDATWPLESIPMLLWTFAHLVGGALRRWWTDERVQ